MSRLTQYLEAAKQDKECCTCGTKLSKDDKEAKACQCKKCVKKDEEKLDKNLNRE